MNKSVSELNRLRNFTWNTHNYKEGPKFRQNRPWTQLLKFSVPSQPLTPALFLHLYVQQQSQSDSLNPKLLKFVFSFTLILSEDKTKVLFLHQIREIWILWWLLTAVHFLASCKKVCSPNIPILNQRVCTLCRKTELIISHTYQHAAVFTTLGST